MSVCKVFICLGVMIHVAVYIKILAQSNKPHTSDSETECVYIYIYIYIYMCVCVCVCVQDLNSYKI